MQLQRESSTRAVEHEKETTFFSHCQPPGTQPKSKPCRENESSESFAETRSSQAFGAT